MAEKGENVSVAALPTLASESAANRGKGERRIPCMVSCCRNAVRTEFGVSFHRWPKHDREQRSLWIAACGRKNVTILDNQGICGLHFEDSCFEKDYKSELLGIKLKRWLRKGALPTLRLRAGSDEFVIRKVERIRIGSVDGASVTTNKVNVEVGPAYEHSMKTIAEPQLISLTADRVVVRPNLNERTAMLSSECSCCVKRCPFQDEKAFLFCFPESEYLRETWTKVCNVRNSTDRSSWVPRVCSFHFPEPDFETVESETGFRDLKSEAVPTLYVVDDDDRVDGRSQVVDVRLPNEAIEHISPAVNAAESVGVQVDGFPEACSLLVFQCMEQLKSALRAKDEEIQHLRLLVYLLNNELSKRRSRKRMLVTPIIVEESTHSQVTQDVVEAKGEVSQAEWTEEVESPEKKKKKKKPVHSICDDDPSTNPSFVRSLCCVPGCPSSLTVAYHRFPFHNKPVYEKWIENCFGRSGLRKDFSKATVCGDHFGESCFDIVVEVDGDPATATPQAKVVLKDDAMPTLRLNKFRNIT